MVSDIMPGKSRTYLLDLWRNVWNETLENASAAIRQDTKIGSFASVDRARLFSGEIRLWLTFHQLKVGIGFQGSAEPRSEEQDSIVTDTVIERVCHL